MTLPPKALNVLVDLKKSLLQHEEFDLGLSPDRPMRDEPEQHTPERTMRHARRVGGGFQRMCRARNW